MAEIIDGKAIADEIQLEIKAELEAITKDHPGKLPGLAVILVGDRKDSLSYVTRKKQSAQLIGYNFVLSSHPETITQDELIELIEKFNSDDSIHGIIVQLPLPKHIIEKVALKKVALSKDVDGFHAENIGGLAMKGGDPLFTPCTPKGCIELLDRKKISIAGKNAVVLGRSNIVGIPASLLLLHRDATVTVCHSQTKDLQDKIRQADILIAAIGKPLFVKADWIKPGAVVIDVGMNSLADPSRKLGYRLCGDVDFDEVKNVAGAITPVPGGVGPMTVAMLLKNTFDSFKRTL
eukprot:TRINITY_DN8268_c0_g1_i1.p2 TRINITY_DN8268_c0_g1~~TRINITY_DN8268_c0_g1_i1.p2  ORF type:complete len:292 (+),score=152.06 TRINITY_DN8268_c0_g1_i1:39-914(+)